ncbi:MAG TPA: polyprenyl diphosphate synthase [Anaerolineales bacterium]|nr:polyprenyl diphosphate synthase [Anaerolineales bacterium]
MKAYLEPKYKPINELSKPRLRELVKSTHLNHLMLVCDGNRRWARKMGYQPSDGHRRSFGYLMENLVSDLIDLDIHTISMYCASTYNMVKRDKGELSIGMGIIEVMIRSITPIAMSNNVRFIHLGRKDRITKTLRNTVEEVERITKSHEKHVLNFAMDYSGEDETIRAIKRLVAKNVRPEEIQTETIENELDTAGQRYPNIDLVIRPAGATRLSGLSFWQSIFSELYFSDLLFPEFSGDVLEEAIMDFSSRKRRFGS